MWCNEYMPKLSIRACMDEAGLQAEIMKLKRFHDTKAPLANGHKRDSLLMMPDHKFESNHGFTQWAVPTAEKSNHNFNAPVLDLGSAIWLAERNDVSKFFENMSVRFLEFLKRNDHWKSLYEHNHLRVSRAIDSLRPLHSWKLADWFYAKVKAFADSSYELMSDARTQWGRKASVEHDRISGAFVGLSMGDALCFKIKYKMGKR